ncbi:hypothetical protein BHM03_00029507 [Ensete ventricosum]|uniref:Uncharacterized protein n=1 Tax=Ensete ventricosum TaxID=4639 RepID=A0A445MI28_ENSVE|nr:hypothetical protein BHM03_00029507 [Ensete ventricosum]
MWVQRLVATHVIRIPNLPTTWGTVGLHHGSHREQQFRSPKGDQIYCESIDSFGSDPSPPISMLSNHLRNGIQTAKVVWSRLLRSEEGEAAELEFRSHGGTGTESLDYEVIENYAYRKMWSSNGCSL